MKARLEILIVPPYHFTFLELGAPLEESPQSAWELISLLCVRADDRPQKQIRLILSACAQSTRRLAGVSYALPYFLHQGESLLVLTVVGAQVLLLGTMLNSHKGFDAAIRAPTHWFKTCKWSLVGTFR